MKIFFTTLLLLATCFSNGMLFSQTQLEEKPQAEKERREPPDTSLLAPERWKEIDASLERSLVWLASQQQEDGSFESPETGQPAITSFCVMAFLAQGQSPANGQYQEPLSKAIDFIAAQQKANGLIATTAPNDVPIPRLGIDKSVSNPSVYNHAISGLALAEAYGQCTPEQAKRLAPVIEKGIAATLEMQSWGPKVEKNEGGWRYLDNSRFPGRTSDLSVTGWQLMFLRSAKNAGFDVPQQSIDAAVRFVGNCFLIDKNGLPVHAYLAKSPLACTRAMAGAGVLAMAHAGKHESKEAVASGEWILKHDFSKYNDDTPVYGMPWWEEHYHYSSLLCTQAMFQLGGKYWKQFFPPLVHVLLTNQKADGSWPPEKSVPQYGSCYSTSLCILSLSVTNQMLPIFQR